MRIHPRWVSVLSAREIFKICSWCEEYGNCGGFMWVTELRVLHYLNSSYLELMNFKCLTWNENMFATRFLAHWEDWHTRWLAASIIYREMSIDFLMNIQLRYLDRNVVIVSTTLISEKSRGTTNRPEIVTMDNFVSAAPVDWTFRWASAALYNRDEYFPFENFRNLIHTTTKTDGIYSWRKKFFFWFSHPENFRRLCVPFSGYSKKKKTYDAESWKKLFSSSINFVFLRISMILSRFSRIIPSFWEKFILTWLSNKSDPTWKVEKSTSISSLPEGRRRSFVFLQHFYGSLVRNSVELLSKIVFYDKYSISITTKCWCWKSIFCRNNKNSRESSRYLINIKTRETRDEFNRKLNEWTNNR